MWYRVRSLTLYFKSLDFWVRKKEEHRSKTEIKFIFVYSIRRLFE
jgi:hypothetical protein